MSEAGVVVARHRRHAGVELGDGSLLMCTLGSRRQQPIVGDLVDVDRTRAGEGIVRTIRPRHTLLTRVDARGRPQPVAANLTQLAVVVAAEPRVDWVVLDHYLAAAELASLRPLVLFNKIDLVSTLPPEFGAYGAVADVIAVSAKRRTFPAVLEEKLAHERSAFVGQSGVGKSSLINALLGAEVQQVAELTTKAKQGKHTTTAATLFRLRGGGELVDSPGVRNYAPYIEHESDVARGYREFRSLLGTCRFDDCRHLAEPGCAIKQAVTRGDIASLRYDSFVKLCTLVETLRVRRSGF
jgi:ribosome biogenesis GTPase / thiamine phosphate phosphatase